MRLRSPPLDMQSERRLDLQHGRTNGPSVHHEHIPRAHRLLVQHRVQLAHLMHPVCAPLPRQARPQTKVSAHIVRQ